MERPIDRLAREKFEVLVVGGGVVGACAAWEASLRGLRVALVERGDFASATSGNSLKILHGGLRYLQELSLRRVRTSSRERSFWLRAAPHLAEPLPFLVPLKGEGLERPPLAGAGLRLYDLLTLDRNRGLEPGRRVPGGRVVSTSELSELSEGAVERSGRGVLFHDGLAYSSERLVLEVVLAAREAGAAVANYASFEGIDSTGVTPGGTVVRDRLGGRSFTVRTELVLNAAGPWSASIASAFGTGSPGSGVPVEHCTALNLVTKRPPPPVGVGAEVRADDAAVGPDGGARRLFLVPWRGQTLVGTGYFREVRPEGSEVGAGQLESRVAAFLRQVNRAFSWDPLARDEVTRVHMGRLPLSTKGETRGGARLREEGWVEDHGRAEPPHLLSAGTVKFTTGRLVAERAVEAACQKLGRPADGPSPTRTASLPGAPNGPVSGLVEGATARFGDELGEGVVRHLVRSYGRRFEEVLDFLRRVPEGEHRVVPETPVTRGELAFGAAREMAASAEDLLSRRTEIGARGWATPEAVRAAEEALRSFGPVAGPSEEESPAR